MTMKRTADTVLIGLAVLFVISLLLMRIVGEPVWLLALQAALEGALVGSAADWFAVRALFEAPLGIRFHTRLVPRNRGRLLRAIADGVQKQVLPRAVIRSRVSETRLVPYLVRSVEEYGVEKGLDKLWSHYVRPHGYGEKGADYLLRQADALTVSSLLSADMANRMSGQLLAWASRKAQSEQVRAWTEAQLEKVVEEKTSGILGGLLAFIGRASGSIDTKEASAVLTRVLASYLREASADEKNDVRMWLTKELHTIAARLDEKNIVRTSLAYPRLHTLLAETLGRAAADGESAGRQFFLTEGGRLWCMLVSDEAFRTELEAKLHWAIYRLVETRGYLIGEVIERTLERYSEDEMRAFIEDKVGDDLEWIRLNGAVLGGILGLLFFLILHALGITLG